VISFKPIQPEKEPPVSIGSVDDVERRKIILYGHSAFLPVSCRYRDCALLARAGTNLNTPKYERLRMLLSYKQQSFLKP
jgi:hypothetical protein